MCKSSWGGFFAIVSCVACCCEPIQTIQAAVPGQASAAPGALDTDLPATPELRAADVGWAVFW